MEITKFNSGNGITSVETRMPWDSSQPALASPGSGFAGRRRRVTESQLADCSQVWADLINGKISPLLMQEAFHPGSDDFAFNKLSRSYPAIFNEAMSVQDFSILTDNLLHREILATWPQYEPTYESVVRIRRGVKDFRTIRSYQIDGMLTPYDQIHEFEPHKRRQPSQAYTEINILKYEAGFGFSWEAAVNDDLGLLQILPTRLVQAGVNSINKYVTQLFVSAGGPNATTYTTGHLNKVTGNPVLSLAAIETALAQMASIVDVDGNPIMVFDNFTVVTGNYRDYIAAQNIKRALFANITEMGGTTNQQLRTPAWVADKFQIIYNPWIPLIDLVTGTTSWYIFANPNSGRPALELNFLAGFDTPQLFRKVNNTVSAAGGGVDSTMGDFETMTNDYKAMLVFGGGAVDYRATMVSLGTGS